MLKKICWNDWRNDWASSTTPRSPRTLAPPSKSNSTVASCTTVTTSTNCTSNNSLPITTSSWTASNNNTPTWSPYASSNASNPRHFFCFLVLLWITCLKKFDSCLKARRAGRRGAPKRRSAAAKRGGCAVGVRSGSLTAEARYFLW